MGRSYRSRPKKLGAKLKLIRIRLGLTQAETIKKLNVKSEPLYPTNVSEYERGKREPPLRRIRLGETQMPIIITFDIASGNVSDYGRIQSFFERFGWENLGGTAYRYPPLGSQDPEDWFNRVIPALMLLREALLKAKLNRRKLYRFTLDVQSSTGYAYKRYGKSPTSSKNISLQKPSNLQFGEKNLRDWLTKAGYPY